MARETAPVEPEQPDDAEPEHTVVIDRDADAHTVVVEREIEHTEVIDRAIEQVDDAEAVEHTEVIDRSVDDAEQTEVIDRSVDHTEVIDRSVESTIGTVAIERERAAASLKAPPRRRRGMTMPPVEPGFGREAVAAVGPGAVATYVPRAIPEPPTAPAAIEAGPDATRAPAPSMPSVLRRSRKAGFITLGLFVAAIVVSVVGLIFIAVTVFG